MQFSTYYATAFAYPTSYFTLRKPFPILPKYLNRGGGPLDTFVLRLIVAYTFKFGDPKVTTFTPRTADLKISRF
jgi:hypothetical protein